MYKSATLLAAAALAPLTSAHIHIIDPVALTAPENPNFDYTNIDYSINNPITTMSDVPCKSQLQYLGQSPMGDSVATYAPGGTYTMTIGTGADHNGGSCQISLSYDQGQTFKVIKSIIGGCAKQNGNWEFTVPEDAPEGEAVFAWSWNNRTGNREFYNACAAVTIGGGGPSGKGTKKNKRAGATTAFDELPEMFVANVPGSGWCIAEGVDVVYPDGGDDVDNTSDSPGAPTQC